MSRDGGRPGSKGGRAVTPDEAELWERLARSVDKVKAKPRVASHAPPTEPPAARAAAASAKAAVAGSKPVRQPRATSQAQRPAPLATLDRRAVRQIASGRVAIDARLDLHGVHQRDARARLRAFLLEAQAKGCRNVLVITGKGGAGPADPLAGALGEPQRGVLRRSVPHWLEQPELHGVVLGYVAAGVRHGGDGALYVQLRKARDT